MAEPSASLSPELEHLVQQIDQKRRGNEEAREVRIDLNRKVRAAVHAVRRCTADELPKAFVLVGRPKLEDRRRTAERLVRERWEGEEQRD